MKALYIRAIRDADREGMLWTPVFDVLSVQGGLTRVSLLADSRTPDLLTRFDRLADWVRQQRNRKVLDDLLRFRAPCIEEIIARNISWLDERWFERFSHRWSTLDALITNPIFDESWRAKVIQRLVAIVESGIIAFAFAPCGVLAIRPRFCPIWLGKWRHPNGTGRKNDPIVSPRS